MLDAVSWHQHISPVPMFQSQIHEPKGTFINFENMSGGYSIVSLVAVAGLVWLALALYQVVPQPVGSERSMKEIKAWTCMVRQSYLFLTHSEECVVFLKEMMNKPPLEKVQPPPFLQYDIRTNFSIDILLEETKDLKLPFIITGFDKGLDQYKTFDSAKENLGDDSYPFEVIEQGSNAILQDSTQLPLHHAMDRMKLQRDLYLRFSTSLAANNPHLDEAMINVLDQAKIKKHLEFTSSTVGRLCFLGYGSGFTTLHNAWMDSWFVQVAGVKKWRIVAPEYAPYIFPNSSVKVPAAKGEILNIPDDSPLPYLDFTTRPGDLFYFPAFWWHEVVNVGEGMNLGCGYRPMLLTVKQAASSLAIPSLASHKNNFMNFVVALPSVVRKAGTLLFQGHEGAAKWWVKKEELN